MSFIRSAFDAYMVPFRGLRDYFDDKHLSMTAKVIPPVAAFCFAALSVASMVSYFTVGPVTAGVFFTAGIIGLTAECAIASFICSVLDRSNNAQDKKHTSTRTNAAGQTVTGTAFDLGRLATLEKRMAEGCASARRTHLTEQFARHAAGVTIESTPVEFAAEGQIAYVALDKQGSKMAAAPARRAANLKQFVTL